MKRILFLLVVIGLGAGTVAMAGMSTSKVRKETRFLTDKMAYELNLSTRQYNDAYEINYDFIYSVRDIMDYVARGYEWALDDYYEALDIRNDDLRWVLSDVQYRRFIGADYFYRPIYVTGGRWSFRIYINYPNRSLFYFGIPYHYRTYCGAHYRPHIHYASHYRNRYADVRHYAAPHRVRDQRTYHSYRRSDFGSVHFRPNSSVRPHNAPVRSGAGYRPSAPSDNRKPNKEATPDRNAGRGENGSYRRTGVGSGASGNVHRPTNGKPASAEPKRENQRTGNTVSGPNRRSDSNYSGRSNGTTEKQSNTAPRRSDSSTTQSNTAPRRSDSSTTQSNTAPRRSDSSTTRSNTTSRRSDSSTTRSDTAPRRSDSSTTRSNATSSGQSERRSSSGNVRGKNDSSSSRSSERSGAGRR